MATMITALLSDTEARAIEAAHRGTPAHADLAARVEPAYGAADYERARIALAAAEAGDILDRLALYAAAAPTWLHRQAAQAAATRIRLAR